ncbi:MAG: tetratricopeptide repeat protein [Iphinoe sp. HA4291-MV1]|nr:tetratricopeptide repeat protein [Iphinoe sp. HA4291-MV1]
MEELQLSIIYNIFLRKIGDDNMVKQKQIKHFILAFSVVIFTFLFTPCSALAQNYYNSKETRPISLVSGLGTLHHPVSTNNPEAQRFFDQGLTFIYAFNHNDAFRSFKCAAELDSQLAMAYWGIALSLGSHINIVDVDPLRAKAAYEAVEKASFLASKATENERAYIEALAKRYSLDPKANPVKLAIDYKDAMREVVRRYPDDLDAATLYAESMMDLRPWQLWSTDGKAAEGTTEIIAVLESVLKREPNHIGANHYYIHSVEASPHPELAIASADRLRTLVPGSGHLVHMPSHIYARIGDYEAAVRSNEEATKVDQKFLQITNVPDEYLLKYYTHNLHFLTAAYMMSGQFSKAKEAAERLETQLETYFGSHYKEMPALEVFLPNSMLVPIRFHKWDDILELPKPSPGMQVLNATWHFARGMAYAANGQIENAEAERNFLNAVREVIPPEKSFSLSSNSAKSVFKIADLVLQANIALAQQDNESAIELLKQAVKAQDVLSYFEPPDWFFSIREDLGSVLLANHDYQEAEEVFREDLEKNPRNGRSLFGLSESLRAQGDESDAEWIQREFEIAWKNADTQPQIADSVTFASHLISKK